MQNFIDRTKHIGDYDNVDIQYFLGSTAGTISGNLRFSGAQTEEDAAAMFLESQVQISCRNRILFHGTIMDLAIWRLRQMPPVPAESEHA